jgi:glycosyltransferase involved in cell wall biosynthesis
MPMTPESANPSRSAYVSLGIIAWNEAESLPATLESLFRQSLFAELLGRKRVCELICVANGCTDRTAAVAAEVFARQSREHPAREGFRCRVEELAKRGKVNAWNQFVHSLSSREARFLFLMDADIRIAPPETLWNMLLALEADGDANVTVDRPCKDISLKRRHSVTERLSLAASQLAGSAPAQLCGQLYCIRAEVARNIYLPEDLAACEDGFIKALVCTDFLAHAASPKRIRLAMGAAHTFEAYTSPGAILRNQKRQIMGQTIVHVLVDQYLRRLPGPARARMAETLKELEAADPGWLKRLISEHLRRTRFFWRLYPGLLGHRFRRLAAQRGVHRLTCLPAALAGVSVALVSSVLAHRALKRGCTDYWPRSQRLRAEVPEAELNPDDFNLKN